MRFKYSTPRIKSFVTKVMPLFDYLKVWFLRPKVVLHGSYYTTNIGDIAIGQVLKSELKKRGIRSMRVSRFCTKPPCRNIVAGGGGIFHIFYKNNLYLRTSFITESRNVMYIGVGTQGLAGIEASDRAHLMKLHSAKYVSVRDAGSREELRQTIGLSPETLACPAWLFDRNADIRDFSLRNNFFMHYYNMKYFKERRRTEKKGAENIALVLNGIFDLKWLPQIKQKIRELSKKSNIYLIPFVGEDLEFYDKELSDLDVIMMKLRYPAEAFRLFCESDKIIATRYHSVILGLLTRKPVMILAYSPKVTTLAEDLNLRYFDLVGDGPKETVFNVDYDGDLLKEKISEAELNIERIIENLV